MEVLREDWLATSEERLAARYGDAPAVNGAGNGKAPAYSPAARMPERPQPAAAEPKPRFRSVFPRAGR